MQKILIVDDQNFNHIILKDTLSDEYEFFDATSGQEAIDIIEQHFSEISLVLLDLQMEGVNGFDVLRKMNAEGWIKQLPVIVVTSDSNKDVETQCLELNASDFIFKPFNTQVIKKRIYNVISLFTYQKSLEEKVKEQTKKLDGFNVSLLNLLGFIVEYRDSESGYHVYRVKKYTEVLAKEIQSEYPEYNLSDQDVLNITNASVLHDLGKIAIPDNILLKPGKLTAEEFEVMKSHTVKGSELVTRTQDMWDPSFFKVAYEITRHHHEKYDGRGYPDKLVGDEIPIAAQIVSIVDCFDALVTDRVYKKAYTPEVARDMLNNGDCGTFSPKILACFNKIFDKLKFISENIK